MLNPSATLGDLLSPRSVAVVGASRRPDSIGGAIFRNLLANSFQGPVYPVNPRRFTQIARRVARVKPILAVKSGRTGSGRRAAQSHTGALAGADLAVDALFRQAGVVRTDTIEELFDTALLLAHQPLPKGGASRS